MLEQKILAKRQLNMCGMGVGASGSIYQYKCAKRAFNILWALLASKSGALKRLTTCLNIAPIPKAYIVLLGVIGDYRGLQRCACLLLTLKKEALEPLQNAVFLLPLGGRKSAIVEDVFFCQSYKSNIVPSLRINLCVCAKELRGPSLRLDTKVQYNAVWNNRERPQLKDCTCLSFCTLRNRNLLHVTQTVAWKKVTKIETIFGPVYTDPVHTLKRDD